jgi:hypothetical protein
VRLVLVPGGQALLSAAQPDRQKHGHGEVRAVCQEEVWEGEEMKAYFAESTWEDMAIIGLFCVAALLPTSAFVLLGMLIRWRFKQRKRERRTVFTVRLNPQERVRIETAAKRAGLGVTEWARQQLLNSADGLPSA